MDSLYAIYDMKTPKKVIVSMYLVKQFESMDFKFDTVVQEEILQDQYEDLLLDECEESGGTYGKDYAHNKRQ